VTSSQTPAVRRVQIVTLSARAELGNVLRMGAAVAVGVWMYLAVNGASFQDSRSGQRNLLPFQQLIRDRPQAEQRVFRELQEGLLEAEAKRAGSGTWPQVSLLAANGIPPFAPDPTAKNSRYDWRLLTGGAFVNYLGLPERPDAPAWLLLVQEPEPGRPPDQTREDEEHHRLSTGAMLHVSTWVHADGKRVADRMVRMPQAEGWMQLYAVGPVAAPSGR
jgi:hypothetical protein